MLPAKTSAGSILYLWTFFGTKCPRSAKATILFSTVRRARKRTPSGSYPL